MCVCVWIGTVELCMLVGGVFPRMILQGHMTQGRQKFWQMTIFGSVVNDFNHP